jgi:hypothetical protein
MPRRWGRGGQPLPGSPEEEELEMNQPESEQEGNMGDNRDHTEDLVIRLLSHMTRSQDEANQRQAEATQRQEEMMRNQQQTLEVLIQLVGQRGQTGPNAEGNQGGGRTQVEGRNTHIPTQSA